MRGAARARVAALGVLWSVDPSELGISAPQAVSELLQAGAVIARRDSDGSVYFRALGNDAQRIADLVSRSEEHTSELQSLMRISYAVFCLKKKNMHTPYKKKQNHINNKHINTRVKV